MQYPLRGRERIVEVVFSTICDIFGGNGKGLCSQEHALFELFYNYIYKLLAFVDGFLECTVGIVFVLFFIEI